MKKKRELKYKYYVCRWESFNGSSRYRFFRIGENKRYYRLSELCTHGWNLTDWTIWGLQKHSDGRCLELNEITRDDIQKYKMAEELMK